MFRTVEPQIGGGAGSAAREFDDVIRLFLIMTSATTPRFDIFEDAAFAHVIEPSDAVIVDRNITAAL